jgi:hypothetical protein
VFYRFTIDSTRATSQFTSQQDGNLKEKTRFVKGENRKIERPPALPP